MNYIPSPAPTIPGLRSDENAPDLHEIETDDIPSASPVAQFDAYWHRLRHGLIGPPPRANFDLRDVPLLLPHLAILDLDDERQWRVRLHGTACAEITGADWTKRRVEEIFAPGPAAQRVALLADILVTGEPAFSCGRLPVPGREFLRVHRGVWPFHLDGADRGIQMFMALDLAA